MFAAYHSLEKKNTLKIEKIVKVLFLNETFPFLSCYSFLQERSAINKLRASWYGKRSLVSCFVPSSCLDMCIHCNLPWCKDYWQGNYQSMMPRTNPFTDKHSWIMLLKHTKTYPPCTFPSKTLLLDHLGWKRGVGGLSYPEKLRLKKTLWNCDPIP